MTDQGYREEYARRLMIVTDEAVGLRVELTTAQELAADYKGQLDLANEEHNGVVDAKDELVREQSKLIDQQRRHLDLVRSAGIEIHDTTDAEELRKMVTGHEVPQEIVFNNKDDDSDPDD